MHGLTPPLPGDTVGGYTLGEVLGVGGNATVYLAKSEEYEKVALKILHPGKIGTDERRRFRREFLTLQRLRHPGIVQVYEFGEHGDFPWIAMEYVEGSDLNSQLKQWKLRPSGDRFAVVDELFRKLCEVLAYVHEQGVIHRDLKPSNVLLTVTGEPKLSDFGGVKIANADTFLTMAGQLVGTVAFMSPEQIMGETLDSRSDLYSLGAMLYLMLTLTKPIEADSIAGYLAQHLTYVPRPPSDKDPRTPRALDQICTRLLLKDPAQRFSSARQLLQVLSEGMPAAMAPLHGRDDVIAQLLKPATSLEQGAGGVLVISGPPGIGKTALIIEWAERARTAGVDVVTCGSDDPDPFVALAKKLPPTQNNKPIEAILDVARKRSIAIIFDDLDTTTEAVVNQLTTLTRDAIAVEGLPILVVITIVEKTPMVRSFVDGVSTGLSPTCIEISGLDRRSVSAIMRDRNITGSAAVALGHRLHSQYQGNPGEVIRQVETLVKAGWLTVTPAGDLRATRSIDELRESPLPVSDQVRDELQEHLKVLSADERRVLNIIVVLNDEGTEAFIGRVAGLGGPQFGVAVATLKQHKLIVTRMDGAREVITLAKDQNQSALYSTIYPERRTHIHRDIANTYRGRSRRRVGPMAKVIGDHLVKAGDISEAWPLLLLATQRELRVGELSEARRLLRQAMDARSAAEPLLSEPVIQRNRRLLYSLDGEVRTRTGDHSGAIEAWKRAVTAAELEGDDHMTARVQSSLGLAHDAAGDMQAASKVLEAAIRFLPCGDPIWPRIARALGANRLELGQVDAAAELWGSLLEFSEAMESSSDRAEALAGLGIVAMIEDDISKGRDMLAATLPHLGLAQGLRQAKLNFLLIELDLAAGRLHHAKKTAIDTEKLATQMPKPVLCVRAQAMAAWVCSSLGQDDEARDLMREAMTVFRDRSLTPTLNGLRARLPLARMLARFGEWAKAKELIRTDGIADELSGLDDPIGQAQALLARIQVKQDAEHSRVLVKAVQERPSALLPWTAIRIQLDLVHALLSLGDNDRGVLLLEDIHRNVDGEELSLMALEVARLGRDLGLGEKHNPTIEKLQRNIHLALGEPSGFLDRWK